MNNKINEKSRIVFFCGLNIPSVSLLSFSTPKQREKIKQTQQTKQESKQASPQVCSSPVTFHSLLTLATSIFPLILVSRRLPLPLGRKKGKKSDSCNKTVRSPTGDLSPFSVPQVSPILSVEKKIFIEH
jgi:hypothetical protein